MKMPEAIKNRGNSLATLKATFSQSRGIQVLSGVLVLQLALAGGLLWRSGSDGDFATTEQWVAFDPASVEEIQIGDGEDSVLLTRADGQWRMDDEHQSQAATDKVDELLSSLSELKSGLPVASTPGSHAQLEVDEDEFQRRLTIKTADATVADLFLGTSPGFRKSHARSVDQDEVYAVRLNTFDVPADKDDWLDRNLLQFGDISSIESDGMKLALGDDQWSIVEPKAQSVSHEVDTTQMDSVISQLQSLRVLGFAEPLQADDLPLADASEESADGESTETEPLLVHEVIVVQDEEPITLSISKKGSEATIERSDVPGVYGLSVASFDAFTPESLKQLIVEKTAEATEDGEQQPNG